MASKAESQQGEMTPDRSAPLPARGADLSGVLAATRAPDSAAGGQVLPVSNASDGWRLTPPPEPGPSPADVLCPNPECGVRLVVGHQDGTRELQVYERHIRRPHILTEGETPLAWRCHACGTPVTIE